ncbi:hypothetical protein FA13DRAFT_1791778 [Coprinellus micaceus]|uniref:DUF6533 domain-containing protein n=1 Tax=Coprinellus micaceus TaxID=71717 RepID=A0A4Y7TA67_COPMI|nr:hypothetical protein FA13DRAFT_1791778 [Coprinellus micaceus]
MSALAALLEGFRHVQITRYTHMAATTIILYDHFLTFDGEVEHVWKARWSAGKVMFIVNRYYTLASVVFNNYGFFGRNFTDGFCKIFLTWQGWTGLVACILAEIILQMRVYAMYSLNKTVLVVLVTTFFASTGVAAWVMQSVLSKIVPKAIHLPDGTSFCMPIGILDHFYMFWIPMLVFECLLCGLAIARAVSTFRFGRGGASNWGSARRLIIVLFRDSVAYFLVICATYLTCLLTWALAPVTLLEVPVTFSVAMSCVLANRIILNVRELGAEPVLSQHSQAAQHIRWHSSGNPIL